MISAELRGVGLPSRHPADKIAIRRQKVPIFCTVWRKLAIFAPGTQSRAIRPTRSRFAARRCRFSARFGGNSRSLPLTARSGRKATASDHWSRNRVDPAEITRRSERPRPTRDRV
jgi:hypothetical protein